MDEKIVIEGFPDDFSECVVCKSVTPSELGLCSECSCRVEESLKIPLDRNVAVAVARFMIRRARELGRYDDDPLIRIY